MSGTTTRSSTKIRLRSSEQRERCTSPASPTSPYGWSPLSGVEHIEAPYPETGSTAPHPGRGQCSDRAWRVTQHRAERCRERLASSIPCYRTTGRVTESTTVPRGQAAAAANRYESRCNDEDGGRDQPEVQTIRVPSVRSLPSCCDGCGASEGAVDGTASRFSREGEAARDRVTVGGGDPPVHGVRPGREPGCRSCVTVLSTSDGLPI